MFLGLEPPDYHSTGTDNQASTSATASNAFILGTNNGTAGSILALYPGSSGTSLVTVTAAAAATTLPARTNVTATAISGATSASYTVPSAATSDNGFYFCKVTNTSGTTNSNTVALTIALNANANLYQNTTSAGTSPAPIIITQPSSATVTAGTSVTFTVAATSSTTLSYQWYKIATTHRAAMETQRAAVSNLATALQADSALKGSALLSGTFSDIVQGVAGSSGDTGFPATYPTGTTGRGVLFSSLTTAEQTTLKPLVKATIEAWVSNVPSDVAATLLADYESDDAINATYIGYQVGSGSATGGSTATCNFDATVNQEQTPVNTQHSYLRIDGPHCWVEMVAQGAVLYSNQKFVHYHSIYRDKLSDYGGEFGSFLNGASTSSGYTGTTYTRPSFTTQPVSATGASTTFTAAATANSGSGTVTPAYQWYSGTVGSGTAISEATSASYTTSTAGSYYVTAIAAYGTTASNQVTLTAATTASAPTITTQPATQTVVSGNTATFTVAATGSGTLSYQWYNAAGAISGATSASYTTGTAGSYYVVVTNTVGTSTAATTSSTATLYVNTPPTITTQPISQTVNSGSSATFSVTTTGNGTLSYQWYNATGAISGAAGSSYTTNAAGTYYAVVTNTLNGTVTTTTSSPATLTVNTARPSPPSPPARRSYWARARRSRSPPPARGRSPTSGTRAAWAAWAAAPSSAERLPRATPSRRRPPAAREATTWP